MILFLCLSLTLLLPVEPRAGASPEDRNDMKEKAVEMYQAGGEEGPEPKMELEHYNRSLVLKPEQRPKILKILEERRKVFRASAKIQRSIQDEVDGLHKRIQELNSGFREEFQKLQGRLSQVQASLRGLLRPDQQKRFDAMEAERLKFEREHRKREEERWRREHAGQGPRDGQGSHEPAPAPGTPGPENPEGARP